MIKIEDTRLRELLESRKQYIGSEELPIDAWFADICFIITFFTVEFKDTVLFPGIVIRTLYIIVFIIYTILLLLKTVKVIRNPYTCENLYKDITSSGISSILQKNTFKIDGYRYRWFTIAEMQRSTDMMRKNDDIINHIRSLYGE